MSILRPVKPLLLTVGLVGGLTSSVDPVLTVYHSAVILHCAGYPGSGDWAVFGETKTYLNQTADFIGASVVWDLYENGGETGWRAATI